MIFGFGKRKNAAADEDIQDEHVADAELTDEELADEVDLDDVDDDDDLDDDESDDDDSDDDEDDDDSDDEDDDDSDDDDDDDESDDDDDDEGEEDEWEALDASRDWREDGPFDITEVDLDADDVERLDFGCVVLTPFEGMQMQLQVDQKTKRVQAALVMAGSSAIEVALFAAPAQSRMAGEIRQEMIEATKKAGGQVSLAEGPFGTEVRRIIPLTDPKGNRVVHISRTWFAEGPKWLLRGVVMGEAAQAADVDSGPAELLYEFFSNTVVRRDAQPRVPGDLIPMTLPASLATSVPETPTTTPAG